MSWSCSAASATWMCSESTIIAQRRVLLPLDRKRRMFGNASADGNPTMTDSAEVSSIGGVLTLNPYPRHLRADVIEDTTSSMCGLNPPAALAMKGAIMPIAHLGTSKLPCKCACRGHVPGLLDCGGKRMGGSKWSL